jgi:hypothetical protein
MREDIKHFLLWITGPGAKLLFAIPAVLLALEIFLGARESIKVRMKNPGGPVDEKAMKEAMEKRRRLPWLAAAVVVFVFYLAAAYIGDRL